MSPGESSQSSSTAVVGAGVACSSYCTVEETNRQLMLCFKTKKVKPENY